MTPWQLSLAIDAFVEEKRAAHDSAAWMMWHGVAISRTKKIPPLTDFLSGENNKVKGIDELAIMERLKAYSRRHAAECQS
jgi:hypothetical protein